MPCAVSRCSGLALNLYGRAVKRATPRRLDLIWGRQQRQQRVLAPGPTQWKLMQATPPPHAGPQPSPGVQAADMPPGNLVGWVCGWEWLAGFKLLHFKRSLYVRKGNPPPTAEVDPHWGGGQDSQLLICLSLPSLPPNPGRIWKNKQLSVYLWRLVL